MLNIRAAVQGKTAKKRVIQGVQSVSSQPQVPRQRTLKLLVIKSGKPGSLEIYSERIYDLIGFP